MAWWLIYLCFWLPILLAVKVVEFFLWLIVWTIQWFATRNDTKGTWTYGR